MQSPLKSQKEESLVIAGGFFSGGCPSCNPTVLKHWTDKILYQYTTNKKPRQTTQHIYTICNDIVVGISRVEPK